MGFENLKRQIELHGQDPELLCGKEGFVRLFCADCDFYKDSDKDLECGAFKLLRLLVEKKALTVEQIYNALGE